MGMGKGGEGGVFGWLAMRGYGLRRKLQKRSKLGMAVKPVKGVFWLRIFSMEFLARHHFYRLHHLYHLFFWQLAGECVKK